MKILIDRCSQPGRDYACDVWSNVGGFRAPSRGSSSSPAGDTFPHLHSKGARSPLGGPLEKLGQSSPHRSFPLRKPASVLRPPFARSPRGNFTRLAFLWGLLVIFLLLATHLGAAAGSFLAGPDVLGICPGSGESR